MISMFSIWQIQLLSLVAFHRCPEHWLKTRGRDRAAKREPYWGVLCFLILDFRGVMTCGICLIFVQARKSTPWQSRNWMKVKVMPQSPSENPSDLAILMKGHVWLLSELSLIFACPYIYRLIIEGAPYCVTFKYKSETSQVIDIKYHISHGNTIYHTYYHISHGNTNKIKVKSHRSRKVGLTLPATTLVGAGLAFVPGIYMSRTNTILKNMQPLLNYLVLIAPAIPTVSNSWIPLNPDSPSLWL